MNLLSNVKMILVSAGAVAAQTEVDSDILDMLGFDGVLFVAILGTVTASSVLTLVAQQYTAATGGSMVTITGATATHTDAGAGADSSKCLIVDVFRPQQRYVRAAFTRTAANAVLQGILAIQYMAGKKPTVQDVTTILASTQVAPAA